MTDQIDLDYDEEAKRAVLTFPNGRKLTLSNVTKEHAEKFRDRHAPEFMRRDCVLHTAGDLQIRSRGNG